MTECDAATPMTVTDALRYGNRRGGPPLLSSGPVAGPSMKTATSVLATVPAPFRIGRKEVGGAERQLRNLEGNTSEFTIKQVAYGVLWADTTGRVSGTISMALRRATPWQAAQLVAAIIRDGVEMIGEVPAWMNKNALGVLA